MPQAKSPTPLKIAVLGAGKIGSTFAFQLAHGGGHEVTVIARPDSKRLTQLLGDQAIVDVKGERAPVRVLDTLDEKTPYDLLIVTVLDHQLAPVLPGLQRSAAKCVQCMFNTFYPERLQQAVGHERCAFGMPFVQAMLNEKGRLNATIGAGARKTIMSEQRWVDLFNESGLPAALEPEMPLWLRCHVPLCVAFESISVAGVRRGGGASWREAMILARGIHASFGLIKALGFAVYPQSKKRLDAYPAWIVALMLWGMSRIRTFRELLATGKTESQMLVDGMREAATHVKKPVDTAAIRAMKPS